MSEVPLYGCRGVFAQVHQVVRAHLFQALRFEVWCIVSCFLFLCSRLLFRGSWLSVLVYWLSLFLLLFVRALIEGVGFRVETGRVAPVGGLQGRLLRNRFRMNHFLRNRTAEFKGH